MMADVWEAMIFCIIGLFTIADMSSVLTRRFCSDFDAVAATRPVPGAAPQLDAGRSGGVHAAARLVPLSRG